jgi:WhiB family redox-sensing transcriptional regulator
VTLDDELNANRWSGAVCSSTDPEIFFEKATERIAVKICGSCPLKVMCAQYAIDNEEQYGVWGGLTETDRAKIRTARTSSRKGIPNKTR